MVYTDEMKSSFLQVERDIADLKAIGSKRLQAKLDHLEADVQTFLDAADEAMDVWDAVEFSHFADRRPEAPCKPFKARQLNRILLPLKELMEEDMGVPLLLVSEEGEHTYSDVMVILRSYLDVAAAFVHRHYNGNTPVAPPVPCNWIASRVQDQILLFCLDQPRSITEIGHLLGYHEKKTTRKYLNPLLKEGLIARTVPDKPNSRNQKYITLRTL